MHVHVPVPVPVPVHAPPRFESRQDTADGERVHAAALVEEQALRLRRRLHAPARWRNRRAEVERPGVRANGARDDPHAVGLERVHLKPAVVAKVGEGVLHFERAEGAEELALAQRADDR